jgi:hypothetical protein
MSLGVRRQTGAIWSAGAEQAPLDGAWDQRLWRVVASPVMSARLTITRSSAAAVELTRNQSDTNRVQWVPELVCMTYANWS